MAQQIPSSPSNKSIFEIIGSIKRGELILQPEFQRKFVWNSKHMESFIETILKGYPFPEIYIAQKGLDLETLQGQQVVVDGQQRLSTILRYVTDDGSDSSFGKNTPRYKDLSKVDQKDFLNYTVVIRDMQDISPEQIADVFQRINQTKFSLNQIEISNAIYDGEFISTAKSILDINSEKFEDFSVFSNGEIDRMGDLHFILILLATSEEGGYYAGNRKTEEYIIKYNDEFPNAEHIKEKLSTVLTYIKGLNLDADSMWYRKSNFFTLVMELLRSDRCDQNIASKLIDFEEKVLQNKGDTSSVYGEYYSYMYSGTNSRKARVERGRIFEEKILQ